MIEIANFSHLFASKTYSNLFYSGASDISYSDGPAEKKILHNLKRAGEQKLGNIERLENEIEDWPTLYHYGWERMNILKPVHFRECDYVLELGGGTGILTEAIAEKVNQIISIEGTSIRAQSICERCKKLKNVHVLAGNFLEMDLIKIFGYEKFDKITLIGVLEYTNRYSNGIENPIETLLQTCYALLKDDGELIIAIENKLGLKYLLGWEEDHVSVPHYGTQSLYKDTDVVTFSQNQLADILQSTGFNSTEFWLPFPDYKIPYFIIRHGNHLKSTKVQQLAKSILSTCSVQNYSGHIHPNVNFPSVLGNFIDDNLLLPVSNSFLTISTKRKRMDHQKPIEIAYYFSTVRRFQYANEIKFSIVKEHLVAEKHWYGPITTEEILNFNPKDAVVQDVIQGPTVHEILNELYLKDKFEEFIVFFQQWIMYLNEFYSDSCKYYYDLSPNNCIYLEDCFHFFDFDEWITSKELSISQLVCKYVKMNVKMFKAVFNSSNDKHDLITKVLNNYNLTISVEDLIYVESIGDYIQRNISRKLVGYKKRNKVKSYFKAITPAKLLRIYKRMKR